jgi:hypothetical protein
MEASNGYNLHATVFYLTAFAIILPIQLSIGLQRGTYGFLSAMFAGTTLEILAYAARVLLCYEKNQYMMYLVPITIAPTFFSIAIYSSMPRIAGIYGRHILSVSPRTYTMTFVIANLLAMVLQAVGGVIAGFDNLKYSQHGLRIIQVGLAAHLLTMTAFLILTTIFAWNTYKQPWQRAKEYESLRHSIVFKAFILSKCNALHLITLTGKLIRRTNSPPYRDARHLRSHMLSHLRPRCEPQWQ